MISEWERDQYDKKMEEWAKNYPFGAMMMFGKQSEEEKLRIAEEMFC